MRLAFTVIPAKAGIQGRQRSASPQRRRDHGHAGATGAAGGEVIDVDDGGNISGLF
ncbi:MAG: hypothetical protein NTW01_04145 [Gammaproteobacteria bacterium]|nr:hypothetical protein [Gammaproteobacteria bacterium]